MIAAPDSPPRVHDVLIVDDHALVRQGLEMIINSDPTLLVAGSVGGAEEAVAFLEQHQPDVVTLDLSLPGAGGVDLVRRLHASFPRTRILVISMHQEMVYAERCLRAGARGYVMKREPAEEVVAAIHRVLRGDIRISAEVTSSMIERASTPGGARAATPAAEPPQALSERELEVFELLGEGLGTRAIAGKLALSIKTVQYYRENIKQKLGLGSAPELEHEAYKWVQRSRPSAEP